MRLVYIIVDRHHFETFCEWFTKDGLLMALKYVLCAYKIDVERVS